jgi:hypothetical protein
VTQGTLRILKNRNIISNNVNALALVTAYEAVINVSFSNILAIEEEFSGIEDQYGRLIDDTENINDFSESGISIEIIDKIKDLRVIAEQFLEEKRENTKKIVNICSNTIPVRVLAYQYYGESRQHEEIIDLNGFTDHSFISGDVAIISSTQ